ncbi:chromate efflux transporter [Thermobifida cellulosilytica]|uniref:Chromate transporter n=1 Tax=Thermobifida cellulosilytica TB100 TaxID=665004 RepID=A0A147KFE9_THECS|nr:chromate efflux transporter [Thermobifida cellulosilytica]KUP96015.1 chromate transporter [Thermobifida cellulosilytica TB100]
MSGKHGDTSDRRARLREVAWVFLKLGTIGFGGPAAHTALMRQEVVHRRGWTSDQRFVDLMSATNLIPGPNSTELALHLGHERAGWRGLVVAGVCFIAPAALMVTVLAWAYVRYGDTPAVPGLLYGVVPVVAAVIVHALAGLVRTVVKNAGLGVLGAAALAAYLLGVHELVVLAAGAAAAALAHLLASRRGGVHGLASPLLAALPAAADPAQLAHLFALLLRTGAVLYGSGYVLVAFLRGDFVQRLGWISEQQLLDAVSVGQLTPGPVFTTAAFVGYLVAGPAGALAGTVAIFVPSFVFVGLLTRITDRLRATAWASAVLDGVNAVSLALMAGVALQVARAAVVDRPTLAVFGAALLLLWRTRLNSAWLIAAGAVFGLLYPLAS